MKLQTLKICTSGLTSDPKRVINVLTAKHSEVLKNDDDKLYGCSQGKPRCRSL